jgi:DNA mismatch repair protein MutS
MKSQLLSQFNAIKDKHPDCILLMKVNDFYETFGDDAVKTSTCIGTVLTHRDGIELTGFTSNSLDTYLPKLVRAGNKVAICENINNQSK